ncbi:hypothetical protein [Celerinatantimonas sp. YJH-8]|uniref:hypothetical protein n=1 Tax=Celerinatantimonas sp. YJH-8 TaxID=3228714 RepID=UPI0038C323EF
MKGDFCGIDDFRPSTETLDAIEQINHVINISHILHKILVGTPFFQIFAGRNTYAWASIPAQGYQVSTTDWEIFQESLKAVDNIQKERIEAIATSQALFAKGKDAIFWECMVNAL